MCRWPKMSRRNTDGGARALASDRHPGKARCLADDGRQAPGAGSCPPLPDAAAQARDGRPRYGAGTAGHARFRLRPGRRYRRRDAAAGLHRLSPAAVAGGPHRAGVAHDLRSDHGGNRARLPAARGDHRPAHRARQADAFGIGPGLRDTARRSAIGAALVGAGGRLPDFQRGLYRGARRALAAPAALS